MITFSESIIGVNASSKAIISIEYVCDGLGRTDWIPDLGFKVRIVHKKEADIVYIRIINLKDGIIQTERLIIDV